MDYLKPKSGRHAAKGAGWPDVDENIGDPLRQTNRTYTQRGTSSTEQTGQATGRVDLPVVIDGLVTDSSEGLTPIAVPQSTPTSSDPTLLLGQATALTSFINQKTAERSGKLDEVRLAIGRRRQILSTTAGSFPAYPSYLGFSINADDTTNPPFGFREGSARFSTALGRDEALRMAGGNAADVVELDPARGSIPAVFGVIIGRDSSTNSLRRGYILEYTEALRAFGNANPPEPEAQVVEGIVLGRARTLRSLLGETLLIRFRQAQIAVLDTAINAATTARTAVQNKLTSLSAARPTRVGLVGIPGGSTVTFNGTVVTGGSVGAGQGAWEGGQTGGTWVLPATPGPLSVVVTPVSGGAKRAEVVVVAESTVSIPWSGMTPVEQPTRIGIAGMPPGSTVSINGTVVTSEPIASGVYGIAAAAGQATVVVTPPGGRARTKTINVIGGVTGVIEFGDMAEAQQQGGQQQGGQQQGGQQQGGQQNAGPVGTIRISGTQHGKVAVDGVIYGETNSTHKLTPVFENGALAGFDILGVSAGGHVVAFLGANDEPYARHPVVVRAGERTRVDFTPPPPAEHDYVEPVGPLRIDPTLNRPLDVSPVIVNGPPAVPVSSGMSTATMAAIAIAVAVGGYYLYNKRK